MYYLNSSLYEPLPAEFLIDIGGIKNYGNFTTDLSRPNVNVNELSLASDLIPTLDHASSLNPFPELL